MKAPDVRVAPLVPALHALPKPTNENDVNLEEEAQQQQQQQQQPSGAGGGLARCTASLTHLALSPRWRRSCFRVGVLWALVALCFALLPYVLRVNNHIVDEFYLGDLRGVRNLVHGGLRGRLLPGHLLGEGAPHRREGEEGLHPHGAGGADED